MTFKPKRLKRVLDSPLTARNVARRIASSLDSDEIARTAQRVKHYAAKGLIYADEGGRSGPGRYRCYNDHSVYHAALVQEMNLSGVNVETIRNAMGVMRKRSGGMSPLEQAVGREIEQIYAIYPDRDISMPVIYLVVNCTDGKAWTGSDLTQAPIGPSQFVFNVAAIFEKVRA